MNDSPAAQRWSAAAVQLRRHFARDFVDPAAARVADHLDSRDVPAYPLRPNALFALPLLDDPEVVARATRAAWEALVYPWGVATLDQRDPNFHPYHVAPGRYHKDAAYHNGAVWPWLNGIAMQRLLELGQADLAWELFRNTNEIALRRGVVGGLPENLDAYPHPGEAESRLTGTYLQGWSNAEHLRIWYQGFLGIHPDLEHGVVRLAPRLPAAVGAVLVNVRLGNGVLHSRYERAGGVRRYEWRLSRQAATLAIDVMPFALGRFETAAGETLSVEHRTDGLRVRRIASDGREVEATILAPDPARLEWQVRADAILAGTRFAQPGIADAHPVMRQVPEP